MNNNAPLLAGLLHISLTIYYIFIEKFLENFGLYIIDRNRVVMWPGKEK